MFIQGSDLQPYCPILPIETLDSIAKDVDNLFCDLLPLRIDEREKYFDGYDVLEHNGWFLVMTSLLNIQSVKDEEGNEVKIKVEGYLGHKIFFQPTSAMKFDPTLTLKITSGYEEDKLPARLKQAMIDYAVELALTQGSGISSTVSSYKM
ncbi:MAG: hypothetical protein LBU27_09170 [Candidatus Peribacteria bacterium]|jgi:hypothetical protein|nr:hypothetical protein [Candidatus Peribacteria bacterium]